MAAKDFEHALLAELLNTVEAYIAVNIEITANDLPDLPSESPQTTKLS